MPHLWMFLLQAITPPDHEVILIDANARAMSDEEIVQFEFFPRLLRPLLSRVGPRWRSLRIIPIESGRGCPYGCEFCTVTGFFGDSIRFRTNQSIVDELLKLKARAKTEGGLVSVFFVDDNFAISI